MSKAILSVSTAPRSDRSVHESLVFLGDLASFEEALNAKVALYGGGHPDSILTPALRQEIDDQLSRGELLLEKLSRSSAKTESPERGLQTAAYGMFFQSSVGLKLGFREVMRVFEELKCSLLSALDVCRV